MSRERYHCPKNIINIVRTKGKAGYLVWKLAGGQGDHEISRPVGSLEITRFFDFWDIVLFVANPLFIRNKFNTNKNLIKERLYNYGFLKFLVFLEARSFLESLYRINVPELIRIYNSEENWHFLKQIPNTFLEN